MKGPRLICKTCSGNGFDATNWNSKHGSSCSSGRFGCAPIPADAPYDVNCDWIYDRLTPGKDGTGDADGVGAAERTQYLAAFYFCLVTLTTVGYGDKAPVSAGGRVVGLVSMFVTIITIFGFTAAIASRVTVNQLQTRVAGAGDLPRVETAVVEATSGEQWLVGEGLNYRTYPNLEKAMRAVVLGEVDALVSDAPVMRYMLREREASQVLVLPKLVREESYAFAVANGSQLREPIDQAMLEILPSEEWRKVLNRYLGADQ